MYLQMKVYGFTLDSIAQMPVVILKDAEGRHALPIWINSMEAVAIAAELISRDVSAESGSDDLLFRLMTQMKLTLERIVFDGLEDGIFDVSIVFALTCDEIRVAARPSEALVMALKYGIPVHVSSQVLSKASTMQVSGEYIFDDTDERRFVEFLERLEPEDFGKYPM